jgi:predicted lipase
MIDPFIIPLAQACAATYMQDSEPMAQGRGERVHVYISMIDNMYVFAFEGTTAWKGRGSFEEWMIDADGIPVPSPDNAYGHVHQGFLEDVLSVRDPIAEYLAGLGWPPYLLTGHSKGASEATGMHAEMKRIGHPPVATRAFEPARFGGRKFRDYMAGENYAWTRTWDIDSVDPVTTVPWGMQGIPSLDFWSHVCDPILLRVPDGSDVPTMHRIPAVLDALGVLAGTTSA